MLQWLRKRGPAIPDQAKIEADAAKWRERSKAGKYRLLYEYLENRYANTVVLTFEQIEALLGFNLPDLARTDQAWWTTVDMSIAEVRCSDAWTLARRTARPNLFAQTVVFERAS